ncbi:MAG: hypothetical protein BGP04_19380 [Rhizobiales bacterium 62-17]|nr:winged helix-turn-helix transcriptional regulator [Hyphomicrobiales bacterium]OJX99827.1 MAG: hypothetical protein BGP04_19380 [Rhizobiales bacterium 62-17]
METLSVSSKLGKAGLGFFLREAHRAYTKELEAGFAAHRITPLQFTFLWILSIEENLSQVELAQRAGITRASATDDIEALKSRKLIRGRRDATDKRKIILSMTAAGNDMVTRLADHAAVTNTTARGELSKQAYRQLFDLLAQVTSNLNAASKQRAAEIAHEDEPAEAAR